MLTNNWEEEEENDYIGKKKREKVESEVRRYRQSRYFGFCKKEEN